MKTFISKYISSSIILFCTILSNAQTPSINWENTYNANNNDIMQTMMGTSDGGYILGGYSNSDAGFDKSQSSSSIQGFNHRHCFRTGFFGTICFPHFHFGAEFDDFWIIKIDANGNKQWDRTIGSFGNDILRDIKQTPDGGYILIGSSATSASGLKSENSKGGVDYWVVKIDSNGNKQWDRTIGGNNSDEPRTIELTPDGGYLLGGYSISSVSGDKSENSKGSWDYWIVKLDGSGNKLWDKTIGGNNRDIFTDMVNVSDGYYLGGYSISSVSGDKSENSKGSWDYWVVKVDLSGNVVWDRTIGGPSQDLSFGLAASQDGGVVINGYSASNAGSDKSENSLGGNDYWVVKLAQDGSLVWENTIGGSNDDVGQSISATSDGGFLLVGYSLSQASGDKSENTKGGLDYWAVKIDSNGSKQWDKSIGGNSSDIGIASAVSTNNGLALGGYSISSASGDKMENSIGNDYWVVQLGGESCAPPEASTKSITLNLDDSGKASIIAADIDSGSAADCGIESISINQMDFDCTNLGNNIVTLTITDVNGNSSTATATVTVVDNVAPAAIAQDITVQLDATGQAAITAADIDNGSSDACGIASLALDNTSFTCSNVGANTVTLTVTDNNGNVSSTTATVTVVDNVAPAAIAQDITVQLDATGQAAITAADIDNGSSDACGIASLALDNTSFTCSNVGANTVTLTVTDNNGNVSSTTATVTVVDNVAPAAIAQDITVQLDANGAGSTTASAVDAGSNDACGIASLALDNTSFTCSNVGANTVTLTVTDNNGNVSSTTATVTVEDNVTPVALAQNVTVQLDASGNASITPQEVDAGSSDACGIASLALDVTSFTCANVGANTVTLTVTDNNGNVSSITDTVTVEDQVAPIALAHDVTVVLDTNGAGSTTAEAVDAGSNDACGVASISISQADFDCSNVGANTVTLTVTDVNGNSSTATATVTVVDDTAPTIIVPPDIQSLNDPDICGAVVDLGIAQVADNCGIKEVKNDSPAVFPVGETIVNWVVEDVNGNISSSTQLVTIDNDIPLITSIVGPAEPVRLDLWTSVSVDYTDNNVTEISIDWGDGTSSVSGSASGSIGFHLYTSPGVYTIMVTVTDACGESAQQTYEFIVVYDPDGGFVTGGGWIYSEPGAYKSNTQLEGKANFGFVSKYKKGATVPTGNTVFQFKAGDLNYHSKDFEWLVITKGKAQFKGVGTINGFGSYRFIITAIDADVNTNDNFDIDRFRIKIWSDQGGIVYDNGLSVENDGTVDIKGGSITVHTDNSAKPSSKSTNLVATFDQQIVDVYPIPFTNRLNIDFVVENETRTFAGIYTTTGILIQRVYEGTPEAYEMIRREFTPKGDMPEGMYLLIIQNGNSAIITKKLFFVR